jgi:hypothetical protein
MMGHREKLRDGDEYDVFTKWRKIILWARGEVRRIKKRFTRRIRRKVKQVLKESFDDNKDF